MKKEEAMEKIKKLIPEAILKVLTKEDIENEIIASVKFLFYPLPDKDGKSFTDLVVEQHLKQEVISCVKKYLEETGNAIIKEEVDKIIRCKMSEAIDNVKLKVDVLSDYDYYED